MTFGSGGYVSNARQTAQMAGGGGDVYVTVNNPLPERTSESAPKAVRRAVLAVGW